MTKSKDHPIREGDNGGRFQCSHGKKRYLLDAPVKTGKYGGHFQGPKSNPRYLLETRSAKVRR